MWELYDRLIDEIPADIKLKSVTVGLTWTAVESSENALGLAMTTDVQTLPQNMKITENMSLKDAAAIVKSWNFVEAGIGMAAINSWYNSIERLNELSSRQCDSRFCTFDMDLENKKVTMIGHMRYPEGIFDKTKTFNILERTPRNGDIPDSACEYFLPESDVVIITGSAFVNKTMPRLLELSKNAKVIITGPSTPMSKELFSMGADRVAGLVVTETEQMRKYAESGSFGPPYALGERYFLDKESNV